MPILNVFELQIFLSCRFFFFGLIDLNFENPKKKKSPIFKDKKTTHLAIKQRASMKCFQVILGLRCQILAQIDI